MKIHREIAVGGVFTLNLNNARSNTNTNNGLRSALSRREDKLLRHFARCLRLKVAIFRERQRLEKPGEM